MKKPLVLVAVGLFLITAVILAIAHRSHRSGAVAVAGPKRDAAVPPRGYYVAPKNPGKPMTVDMAAQAHSEAILLTTYKSYRSAVATRNNRLRDALRIALSKDLSRAIAWAETDLAQAKKADDLEIAQKTLESLRN